MYQNRFTLGALRGFGRVSLRPGETQHVSLPISARDLSMVNEEGTRLIAAGDYTLFIGGEWVKPESDGIIDVVSPIDAVGSEFIDRVPPWLKDLAIRWFGTNDKMALRAGIVVTLAIAALIVGVVAVRRPLAGAVGIGVGFATALTFYAKLLGEAHGVNADAELQQAIRDRTPQRLPALPDVPTVAESGVPELKGFEALAWNGVLVAAGTPRDVVDRINSALNAALHDAAVKERLKAAGLEPVGGTPEQFAKLIHDESVKWAPIIKRSGARID